MNVLDLNVVQFPASKKIDSLEQYIRELPGHFVTDEESSDHVQTYHYFTPGVYTRVLIRRAGVLIVGKRHRGSCLTILLRGQLVVTSSTDDVPEGSVIEEGDLWISLPGTKRATFALEDSVLLTVHQNPTNTQDLAELERMIIIGDDE
jgi:hypothetical protein